MLLAAAQLESMQRPLNLPAPDVVQAAAAPFRANLPAMPDGLLDPAISNVAPKRLGDPNEPTLPRQLDDVELDAGTIDEVIKLFYRNSHPWLPILRAECTPNYIYERSPFLFWSMVSIGIRRYPADPDVLKRLQHRVIDLALMSLKTRDMSLSTIKGLLLVVGWPTQRGGVASDVNFAIAGALTHVAMQLGLHVPVATQDFARVRINLTDAEIQRRAELWAFVLIVYQRLVSVTGQTPFILSDTAQDVEQRNFLKRSLAPDVLLQLNLQTIISRCCKALLGVGLQTMSTDQERALDIIVEVFTQQIKDHEHEAATDLDTVYVYLAQLTLLCFYFYKAELHSEMRPVIRLFLRAVGFLDHLDRMDRDTGVLAHAPFPILAGVMIASFVLLRLLKTPATKYLDTERAKASFFLSLNILRKMVVESEDLPSRNIQVLTQLWNSTKAFKKPDGSDCPQLRIRSRVAMSPIFDALWWWRTEFGGQAGAYATAPEIKGDTTNGPAPTVSQTGNSNGAQDFTALPTPATSGLEEQFLMSDMGWAFDDNFFLSDFGLNPGSGFDQFPLGTFAQPVG